jgi:hypothetical protein
MDYNVHLKWRMANVDIYVVHHDTYEDIVYKSMDGKATRKVAGRKEVKIQR